MSLETLDMSVDSAQYVGQACASHIQARSSESLVAVHRRGILGQE